METKNKTIKTIAPVFVILAAVFWGVLVIFIRAFGQAGFGSMEIVSLRMYSSVIFAWAFVLLFENRKKKKDLRPFHLKDSWCFIGTGLVSIVFFSYCFFRNVEVSSAAVAAILMYTSPIFVTLLSAIFFKERFTR